MIDFVLPLLCMLFVFCIAGTWVYLVAWIGRDATERGFAHGDLLSFVAACIPVVAVGYLLFVSDDISGRHSRVRVPRTP